MSTRTIYPVLNAAQWYREYMKEIAFSEQPAESWDKRAHTMQKKGNPRSKYFDFFINAIDLNGISTVLDVGSGTGALALQLAPHVDHVYCLDYSRAMLDYVELNAREAKLANISTIHLSKEDDWQGLVPEVDVLVSSRSGLDIDIERLFEKFHRHTRQHIYFSYLAGGRFDQPEISSLLNKERKAFPDYIHIINILYEMGIDPALSFVHAPGRFQHCTDEAHFIELVTAYYGDSTADDIDALRHFYQKESANFVKDNYAMKWALIDWVVPEKK